jgi:uncharacterized repeat protein (TIGR03803 family)
MMVMKRVMLFSLACLISLAIQPFPTSATAALASFQVLHSFSGPDGQLPSAPLVQGADGFFYGVTSYGGNFSVLPPDGAGTAFRMDVNGNFTTLHVFTGPDGAVPNNLVLGRDGFFYGTTHYGGPSVIDSLNPGSGVLFRMDSAGNVTVLRRFADASGGFYPGPIVTGADGALYGPAAGGLVVLNELPGLVYRFNPSTGDFRVLHNFNLSDGQNPTGPLFQGADGYLYGTTWQGGPSNTGVIYKVDPSGNFILLHPLQVLGVSEGWEPNGSLVRTVDGAVYGTTHGSNGSVFRLDPNGTFNSIHPFDNFASDGFQPLSGLIQARDGLFYGTTPNGGLPITDPSRNGVVYRMDQAGTVTVMHTFTGPDGQGPRAVPVQGADGQLYGTTAVGGDFGLGVIFRLDPSQPNPIAVLSFSPNPVFPGNSSTGTVTLSAPAPSGGTVVALSSNNDGAATVPDSVTVPAGKSMATFTALTASYIDNAVVRIFASVGGIGISTPLTVTRGTTLASLTLNPPSVTGGQSATGTVTLSTAAPSGGTAVTLSSSNSSVGSVPSTVTVAAGATAASFTVITNAVTTSTSVTISGTYNGSTQSATLMVAPPVTTDTVTITLAQYRTSTRHLRVTATGSSPNAILKVYVTSSGTLIGTLTNNGAGNYSGTFKWPINPQNITVKSNLGGSASATVVLK